MRGRTLLAVAVAVSCLVALGASSSTSKTTGSSGGNSSNTAAPSGQSSGGGQTPNTAAATTSTEAPATTPGRQVSGKLVTLGTGNFSVGTDVQPGLYDVTAAAGESGNFIVHGPDLYDEVLGDTGVGGLSVPKVRAKLSNGDSIQISSLAQVTFTPVSTPYVTTHTMVTLYAGTWVTGQDIGPGRYVATTTAGDSGNFIVGAEGIDEILGQAGAGLGVPSISLNLSRGDTIVISSLSQVIMTPQ